MSTIFQKIIDRQIPAKIAYEDEQCLAFHDVNPQAPVHVLLIPKREIASIDAIRPEDAPLIAHLWTVIPQLAATLGLSDGYRVAVNNGRAAGQTVAHIHFHILGGRNLSWPPG